MLSTVAVSGQGGFNVTGSVVDKADRTTLPSASVQLIAAADTTKRFTTATDLDGAFRFISIAEGNYTLRTTYVGYGRQDDPLVVSGNVSGTIVQMGSITTMLKAFETTALMQRAEQRGDTTIYNAGAFKVNPDASAEDLITKMPGITVDGGTVKAQGEEVKRVLVDGEEFFGDDASIALKNLPAEIIDKVQVFDRLSDQSQFTGFDDGNREKTLNIVTRSGKNQGVFGRASVGYGTDDRHAVSSALNWFRGAERISLLGQRNNINQQNFSAQDLSGISSGSGGTLRGGGSSGGLLQGTQPGINTTGAIGLNYSNTFSKNTKLSGSYFFNQQQSLNVSRTDRTTYLSDTAAQYTTSSNARRSDNFNHRITFRLEHKFDSVNSIIVTPRISLQRQRSANESQSAVTNEQGVELSTTDNQSSSRRDALDLGNSLLYRHKFGLKGRTFSATLTTAVSRQINDGTLMARNSFFTDTLSATEIDQRSDGENLSQRHGLEVNYTEPVGAKGQFLLGVGPGLQLSDAERLTYDVGLDGGEPLNTRRSNRSDNTIRTLRAGLGYRLRGEVFSFNAGLEGLSTDMYSEQTYPFEVTVDRDFTNLLPNAMLMWRAKKGTRLRLNYRATTRTPSITQLQNVVDNGDPLKLTTGNLGLDQSYQHSLSLNFNTIDSTKTRPFFAMVQLQAERDRISNVTFIPTADSALVDGTLLPAGSQFTLPMNLDGYISARVFSNYSMPLTALRSNVNLNTGGSIERLPGAVNGTVNYTWNTNWNMGVLLSSSISERVDFRLGYTANFNTARSELRSSLSNDFYQGRLIGKLTLNGLKGWVVQNEVGYDQYIGLGTAFDRDAFVWNAALGYKFLKNDALELRVSAYDLLGHNVSVSREVSDTYIQSTVTNMLQRYFLFILTFNLRALKGTGEEGHDGPEGDGPPLEGP